MNLRETILATHSKVNCTQIVKWVSGNPQHFDELFNLFMNDDALVRQRAAWPLSYAAIAHPGLVKKHLPHLLKNLSREKLHDAEKRNTVRLLQEIEIPKRFQGKLMSICFDYIGDLQEKAAVKAFSLTILQNLSRQHPGIRQELKTIIDDRWDHESAAFRSRAKKILKEFS